MQKPRVSVTSNISHCTHKTPVKTILCIYTQKRPVCLQKESYIFMQKLRVSIASTISHGTHKTPVKTIPYIYIHTREWVTSHVSYHTVSVDTARTLHLLETVSRYAYSTYEKRPICEWKETHISMKRGLYFYEKRPVYMKVSRKCSLFRETVSQYAYSTYEKRPICEWKEAHISMERGLYFYEKRPV